MTGPYRYEQDAAAEPMPQAVRALFHTGQIRPGDPERRVQATVLAAIEDACTVASLPLGDHDRRILGWLCRFEPTTAQVIVDLIGRAYQSGRRAAFNTSEADPW